MSQPPSFNKTSERPLISVVTPSWNQGHFISTCIESVMGIAPELIEHIIIDNCSDDTTHNVLSNYPHLRTLIENDQGQSDALNKGFAMARADWILWLNADDFLLPGVIHRYLEEVQKKHSSNVIYGHMQFVDENGDLIRKIYHPSWRYCMSKFGVYSIPSTGTLYKRNLLESHPLDIDFHVIMDSEWTLRAGNDVKVKRLQQTTVSFRVTDDNKTSLNIRTGQLTPRHASERKILANRYPWHSSSEDSNRGTLAELWTWVARKLIRIRILTDKAWSRYIGTRFGS